VTRDEVTTRLRGGERSAAWSTHRALVAGSHVVTVVYERNGAQQAPVSTTAARRH
jgi:hypothetical protein